MALARKGSRSITVNGRRFRWHGSLADTGYGSTSIAVEAWDDPGQRLMAHFDPWVLTGVEPHGYLSKKLVRVAIVEGLARGWRPEAPGRQLVLTEDQLYGEHEAPRWIRDPDCPRQLIEALRAAPEDDEPRLVLADWLMERGDVRGELVTLQCAQARRALSTEGVERIATLLERHWRRWSAPARRVARRWVFLRGFVEHVSCVQAPPRAAWETLHAVEPVQEVELVVSEPTALAWLPQLTTRALSARGAVGAAGVEQLARARHVAQLRRLTLAGAQLSDGAAEVLASATTLRALEELDLQSNPLSAAGARTLLESSHLAALRGLVLDRDKLPRSMLDALPERGWRATQDSYGPLVLRRQRR